jgi:ABC-type uncharacterized transport system involved in gliding motility auxiliary subunit|nr:hypothetical protein [bacterium]
MNISKAFASGITGVGSLLFVLSLFTQSLSPFSWYFAIGTFIALSFIPNGRLIRVGFATVALAATVFFLTEFISKTDLGNKSIDLTEDDRYTLTDGTKSILKELSEPITINYYVTRDVDGTPSAFKRHIPRVDSFLSQIEGLAANGLVTLNLIDPEPNTDEEDAALLDQVQQVPVTQDDNLIFGASINSLDKKTVIPLFDPGQETQLEFQVMSAIAEVSQRDLPVVGLISAHNLAMGGQTNRGWLFYQLLQRSYDVANLGMTPLDSLESEYESRKWGDAPDFLDPEKIKVILVIHPAGITPEAEFVLDQYLLRGGTVIACVDPNSFMAQQSGQPQFPGMPPQGGTPPSSSLPKLFEKHNISFDESQVIIDRDYQGRSPQILMLTDEAMTAKDDISLSKIQNIALVMAGGFTAAEGKTMGPGLEVTKLVESSYKYTFVDSFKLNGPSASEQLRFALGSRRGADEKQAYVALLSGNFETAFPDGDPSKKEEENSEENKSDKENSNEKTEEEDSPEALKNGKDKGNFYIISDSDFLADQIAYASRRMFNTEIIQPVTGNGPFMFNILDQAIGSKYLIGARARAEVYRPFTVLKGMEAEFEEARGVEVEKLRQKRNNAQAEIQRITSELAKNNNSQRNNKIRSQIADYNKEIVDANQEIREKQKSYQADVDFLKATIFWRNILYVPLGVIIIGLGVFTWRKKQTKAR